MERNRVQKSFYKPSRTKQEFRDECDLGLTVKRFAKTSDGRSALQNAQGFAEGCRFEDVSQIGDFRSCRETIERANESFMHLPAVVRKKFGNDAAQFLDFCGDPRNLDELRSMGLANPSSVAPVSTEPSSV